jgi:methionine sulfoxide reductase heme-binding subunit
MFGLFAFFYVLLHLSVYVLLDQRQANTVWQEIAKRPYITIGVLALALLLPLAATSTKAQRRLGQALDATAPAHLSDRHSRAFGISGGKSRRTSAQPLLYATGLTMLLGYRLWRQRKALLRVSAARFART